MDATNIHEYCKCSPNCSWSTHKFNVDFIIYLFPRTKSTVLEQCRIFGIIFVWKDCSWLTVLDILCFRNVLKFAFVIVIPLYFYNHVYFDMKIKFEMSGN